MDARLLALAGGLAEREHRAAAAAALAAEVGAEAFLLLIKDPALEAFLPAQGMPQTLVGGSGWRDLLRRAQAPGSHRGVVAYPDRQTSKPALALATGDGLLLVLVGGEPSQHALDGLALPLLAALLRAELETAGALGRERTARDQTQHSGTLAAVLDATRADLERTLEETRRLNAELQASAQAKDEFLAMLAHELRNPLAPIISSLELLRMQGKEAPAFPRLLDVLERQARQLARLVDDLLDVSRISRGLILLRRESVSVQSALSQAIESVRPLLESERHQLQVSVPDEPLFLGADPARLAQVFANLLNNAAKYTNPGGRLEVSARRQGNQVVVLFRDNGIGIEKDVLPRIFDLFTQAPRALDRAKGGLGIGLTLVQRLVSLHGGSIQARSEGIGKGSEFEVRFPLALETPAAKAKAKAPTPTGRPLRVLLIDDNEDAAEILSEMLQLSGYTLRIAGDGEAGILAAEAFLPDVAVVDIGLPKMDGYGVARKLRELLPSATLVALSGYGDEEHRARGLRAGFQSYLVKPVDLDDLVKILGEVGRRGAGAER